jgi:CRISPR type I-E-associated protein CasB/Cse2
MVIATLFPWLPTATGEPDFGLAARTLGRNRAGSMDRVRRQLEDVLAAPLLVLTAKLLPLVRDMSRLRIRLDWAHVLSDLKKWNFQEQPIQRRWARSFLTGYRHADRDSRAAESLAVQSES